jgi:hypothetical protein
MRNSTHTSQLQFGLVFLFIAIQVSVCRGQQVEITMKDSSRLITTINANSSEF